MSYLRKKFTQENPAIKDSQEAQQAPASKSSQEAKQVQQNPQAPQKRQSQQVPASKSSQEAKQVPQASVPQSKVSQEFQAILDSMEFPDSRLDLSNRTTQERTRISDDEEVIEIKLKNAFKLMKDGRYGAARQILRDLPPDNHKVVKLLAMMEGKKEKNRGPAAISKWGLFMVVFVVIAVGGAIVAALFLQSYLATFSLDELFTQGLAGASAEDMETYTTIITFCVTATNTLGVSCTQWPYEVYTEYPDTLDACFAPYRNRYDLNNEEMITIGNCLYRYGVPPPY
jgi:hypothetical protein